jgi:hypothetical protein
MRPGDLYQFNFNDPDNAYLSFARPNPWRLALVFVLVLTPFMVFTVASFCTDCAPQSIDTISAMLLAFFYWIPFGLRVAVLGIALAWIAVHLLRRVYCMYDDKPDFVIGPSGIADLNLWHPRAFTWNDIGEVQRVWIGRSLFTRGRPMTLQFVAQNRPPAGVPGWLWDLLPLSWTGRTIQVAPQAVGVPEDEILEKVEQFAGHVRVHDVYLA